VLHNARLKGDAVATRHPDRPVLSADTTVALDGHVLNKPVDMADARRMLRQLAGRTHTVYTAVALQQRSTGWLREACEESRVTFRPLDDAVIDRYFAIVNPLDKAGAYGIQEGRDLIIECWDGSLTNIMGLPVDTVRAMLEHFSESCMSGSG
jgi:septum formation protein